MTRRRRTPVAARPSPRESAAAPSASPAASGIVLALVAAVLLLYARTWSHGFVPIDDDLYVTANPTVGLGLTWRGLAWAFTTSHADNWHPLTWLSHMLDVELFGLNPGPHHLVGAVLHAANAALLFLALRSLSGKTWPSAWVAALFAVHPLRVESVAWAAERKDVLSGTFFMLTLLAYARYARRPAAGPYALVLVTLGLGLLCKPMLVTVPLVLLLLDLWPLGRRALLEKLPLALLALGSAVLTILAQRAGGAMGTLETVPLAARLGNAALATVAYLVQGVVPLRLAYFYPHPALVGTLNTAWGLWAAGAAALVVLVTVAVLRQVRARPHLTVGWLWYLTMLAPVVGLVQVGMQSRADRYTYLPLIGPAIMLVWSLSALAARRPQLRQPLALAGSTVLVLYLALTWVQVGTWRSGRTLAEHALKVTESNYLAHTGLGQALELEGRPAEARGQYEEAIRIRPSYTVAINNLGNLLGREGRFPEAVALYERAVTLRPDDARVWSNLGRVLGTQGDYPRATAALERALEADPGLADAHLNLGVVARLQGDLARAERHFEDALRLRPAYAEAHNELGSLYERRGDLERAAQRFEAALSVNPRYVEARYNLGVTFARRGDYARAAQAFERALATDASFEPARAGLARIRSLQAGGGD